MSELRCIVCDNNQRFEPLFPHLCTVKNYICLDCGLIFIHSDNTSYQEYYKEDGYYKKSPNRGLRQKVVNKKLLTHLGEMRLCQMQNAINFDFNNKSILDVGCGYGQILNAIKNNYEVQVKGLEPSSEIADVGRRYFDLEITNALLEEFDEKNKYDFIMCNHTLEHVENPKKFLNKIKEYLTDTSYLYIEVPNIMAPTGNFPLDTFLYNEHLFNFSRTTIKRLLEDCGYEVLVLEDKDFIKVLSKLHCSSSETNYKNNKKEMQSEIGSEEILQFLQKYNEEYSIFNYLKVYFNKFLYLLKVLKYRVI